MYTKIVTKNREVVWLYEKQPVFTRREVADLGMEKWDRRHTKPAPVWPK
jgi:hypothetical protein